MNSVKALQQHRQSVWLDFLARSFITKGELAALIQQDGVLGITSNPAIFEKAIAGTDEYDEAIRRILERGDRPVADLYECLAVEDIRRAADALRTAHEATGGIDGFVSLEVSPYLAMDTAGTIAEAGRLWAMIGRNNAMIKVPATAAGLPAIGALLSQGINVNITLLFSRRVYRTVAETYISALETFAETGGEVAKVASVASFFVSRIDSAVDRLLDEKIAVANDPDLKRHLQGLKGKAAIANAKLAYSDYKALFSGERWQKLAAKGAKPQRLLWASTGTKNIAYSDVLYVEELIGPDTVNTVPPATLDAFRDHGKPRNSLEENVDDARRVADALAQAGISLESVAERLMVDGLRLFSDAADSLLGAVAAKRAAVLGSRLNGQSFGFAPALETKLQQAGETWRAGGKVRRLWNRDATLWTGVDEDRWLGWLDCVERELDKAAGYSEFAEGLRKGGFCHAVLLGMGGSSLGAEVLSQIYGDQPGWPQLLVLDSTDPAQVRTIEAAINPATTLFIVSSKSGSTLEPNVLTAFFFNRLSDALGSDKAGRHFIAITDPGSQLEQIAQRDGFRHIFYGEPSIGGRYSVLSAFGLVPAAIAGVDIKKLLASALMMVRSCGPDVPPSQNPGVQLGIAMGIAALAGRDKITILSSSAMQPFGAWLEQLIAESTGKAGKALIPVDGEPVGAVNVYGNDRLFIDLCERGSRSGYDPALQAIERAGHPVVRIAVTSLDHLGQEFFRFEIATAVAGAVIGVNPFDQPDVEASKIRARELMSEFERSGVPRSEPARAAVDGIEIYADAGNAKELQRMGAKDGIESWLRAHFGRVRPGDYLAFLAYVERNATAIEMLQEARIAARKKFRVATCVGFGPRFLHSTGQAHKGGPNSGVFLQITADNAADLSVPGQTATLGMIKAAQSDADFDVLAGRGRRALRVHLKGNATEGLAKLGAATKRVLS